MHSGGPTGLQSTSLPAFLACLSMGPRNSAFHCHNRNNRFGRQRRRKNASFDRANSSKEHTHYQLSFLRPENHRDRPGDLAWARRAKCRLSTHLNPYDYYRDRTSGSYFASPVLLEARIYAQRQASAPSLGLQDHEISKFQQQHDIEADR